MPVFELSLVHPFDDTKVADSDDRFAQIGRVWVPFSSMNLFRQL